jgi:three-Cys-motif partner protein
VLFNFGVFTGSLPIERSSSFIGEMQMSEDFFTEPLEQSKVKSQIVAKYFVAWARIIIAQDIERIAYVDLFAGQGYYEDGTESTPLLILKKAVENPNIGRKLITHFNDQNPDYIHSLSEAIQGLVGLEKLSNTPKLSNLTVSGDIAYEYTKTRLPPTLFFLDPWGYKGLSLELIRAAIKDWASECLLFFNYDRINRDLQNPLGEQNINEFFGKSRADELRSAVKGMCPYKREQTIIQNFCDVLKKMGGEDTLPFCFLSRKRNKTSHYLIHITKNKLGFGIMKEIMAEYSRKDEGDVPTYTFDPKPTMQLTLNFNRPLRELAGQLASEFQGRTVKVRDVYESHQEKTLFVRENYKDALRILEKEGRIEVDKSFEERRLVKGKVTLGDDRIVTFH